MVARIDYLELPDGKYIIVIDNVATEKTLNLKNGISAAMECDPKFVTALVFNFPITVATSPPNITYTNNPALTDAYMERLQKESREASVWIDKDGAPR